jgi:tight adherence protein B
MAVSLLIVVGLGLAGVMLVMTLRSWRDERLATRMQQRLATKGGRARAIAARSGPGIGSAGRRLAIYESAEDARLARWLPGAARLRETLNRTGRSISLVRYVTWTGMTILTVFVGIAALTQGALLLALLVAVPVGIMVPRLLVRRMLKQRLAAFTRQFPDAIDLIVRALRAGLPLTEALVSIGDESADPIGAEFRRVAGAMAIGRSVEEALWEIERNIDNPELRFFIITIATQIQTGGNLGETLGTLASLLRQRARMRMKVKAMTGEARASAGVLGSLPFVIALLMFVTNPDYIGPLFTDPRGLIMLAGGALMLTIGIGIMVKLVSFEI